MSSVFIKVPISERFPKESGDYYSNIGRVYFKANKFYLRDEQVITKTSSVVWWLEEIELPTEEEMNKLKPFPDDSVVAVYDSGFYNGANFILDKLKGGNNG